jgi:hypothetical protein
MDASSGSQTGHTPQRSGKRSGCAERAAPLCNQMYVACARHTTCGQCALAAGLDAARGKAAQHRSHSVSADGELEREGDEQRETGAASEQLELPALNRLELSKRAEDASCRGDTTAAKASDGELNELTHDSPSMGASAASDKLMTNRLLL